MTDKTPKAVTPEAEAPEVALAAVVSNDTVIFDNTDEAAEPVVEVLTEEYETLGGSTQVNYL